MKRLWLAVDCSLSSASWQYVAHCAVPWSHLFNLQPHFLALECQLVVTITFCLLCPCGEWVCMYEGHVHICKASCLTAFSYTRQPSCLWVASVAANEAWYWLKCVLHSAWLCITSWPPPFFQWDVVHWLFTPHVQVVYKLWTIFSGYHVSLHPLPPFPCLLLVVLTDWVWIWANSSLYAQNLRL